MFSVLTGISPAEFRPMTVDVTQQREELKRRTALLADTIKNMGQRAGVDSAKLENLKVIPSNCFSFREGNLTPDGICLSLHLYLDFEKDFGVLSLDDLSTKLNDPGWAQNFVNKIADIFNYRHFPIVKIPSLVDTIRRNLVFMKDSPEKALNSTRFIILHELGHLQNEDLKFPFLFFLKSVIATLVFTYLSLELGFFISATVAALVISFVLALAVSCVAILIFKAKFFRQSNELAADLFAAKAFMGAEGLKIREGGIYFLESSKKIEEGFSSSFHQRLFATHPSDDDRINALKNYTEVEESPAKDFKEPLQIATA